MTTLLTLVALSGASQKYNLTTLNLENGLPSENVYSAAQDKEGYIWFGTLAGLARYDGYDFRIFNDADGLTDPKIKALLFGSENMYVLSWEGMVYKRTGQGFSEMEIDSSFRGTVTCIYEDDQGWFWYTTSKMIVGTKGDSTRHISIGSLDIKNLLVGDMVRDGNILWFLNQWHGIVKYDLVSGNFRKYKSGDKGMINDVNYCLELTDKGSLLVGGYGGLTEFKGDTLIKHHLSGEPNNNRVMSIAKDADGGYWLGLYGRGVMLWNGGEALTIEGDANIPSRYTYRTLVDYENNKWVCTEGGGVYMFNDLSLSVYTKEHGLSASNINAIEVAENGDLLVGTTDGTIDVIRRDSIFSIPITDGSQGMFVFDVEEGRGDLWVAASSGVLRFRDGKAKLFNDLDRGFEVINTAYRLPSNGHVLFGSLIGGFEIQNDTIKYYPARRPANASYAIDTKTIVEDKKGTIWFGTLRRLMFKDGDFLRDFTRESFRQRGILCSAVSDDGIAWMGGENLLMEIRYENNDTVLVEYDIRSVLNAAAVSAILFDGDVMWIGYDKGVLRISLQELRRKELTRVKRYSFKSGFPASEISLGAMVMDKEGVIWAGTYKGLVKIDPRRHWRNENIPRITLDRVELFSETVDTGASRVFAYDQNYFNFRFKAFNYFQSGNILYAYKLEGIDENWSRPSELRVASYPYLPDGNYRFLVKAKYEDGAWSEPYVLYKFEVKAPFWKTWWFNSLVLLIIVGSVFTIIFLRVRKIRAKAKRIKEFSASLLKVQEEERVRIARDLHDTVAQNLLYVRNQMNDGGDKNLRDQIDTTITEIRQIVSAIHPMHIKKFGLSYALESLKKKMEEISDLFISSELGDEADQLFDDEKALHIFRIAQEAFNNVVKHSGATAANISVECKPGLFILRVQDNGKGFDSEKSKATSVSSFGLTSMSERADLIGGTLRFYKGQSGGTVVELTVKTK